MATMYENLCGNCVGRVELTGALELRSKYGQVKRVIIGLTNLLPTSRGEIFLSVNRTESHIIFFLVKVTCNLCVPNQQMFFVDETFDYRQNRILLTLD
jgi:hypothetical protein